MATDARVRAGLIPLILSLLGIGATAGAGAPGDPSTHPVRPGELGVRPFWNTYARRFIYPPAFDLPAIPGATQYRFTIDAHDGHAHTFTAARPTADLSPVWPDVAEGFTMLQVVGLDASGKTVGVSGERVFYRSPGFSGRAGDPVTPYRQAGRDGLRAIFRAPHVQAWLTDGKPDRTYARYCYPNKVIGGLARAMAAYSTAADDATDRTKAGEIARRAADYLLSIRLPDSSPYAHLPPTYTLNVDRPTNVTPPRVRDHWLMVSSAIDSALAFLDLYDLTKDARYLDAATAIADTFAKTQATGGSWPFMVDDRNGKPVDPQRLIPTWVIFLFDRLDHQYGVSRFREARGRAWKWIVERPLKTYQWDAQFEDIKLREPYQNLAREQACDVAVLLLSGGGGKTSPDDVAQAEDLLRFAEDQFTVWAPVQDIAGWKKAMPNRRKNCEAWITPCVLEQYACYDPVARSSAVLIEAYLAAHAATGKPIYLEKARALANGMVAGQAWLADAFAGHGEIPTWNMKLKPINWLNNSYYAANALLKLAEHTDNPQAPATK